MALRTPRQRKVLFLTRHHDFTPPTVALLMKFSVEAADSLGRAVSNSTVLRALLRYAERQDTTWLHDHLFPLIEEEASLAHHRAERSESARRTRGE